MQINKQNTIESQKGKKNEADTKGLGKHRGGAKEKQKKTEERKK